MSGNLHPATMAKMTVMKPAVMTMMMLVMVVMMMLLMVVMMVMMIMVMVIMMMMMMVVTMMTDTRVSIRAGIGDNGASLNVGAYVSLSR